MEKGKKLLQRPRPYPDESLAGYIIRLTEANCYPSVQWIFQMSGLRCRGVYANLFEPDKDDLSHLAYISDIPVDTLWSMAFSTVNYSYSQFIKSVNFKGNIIPIEAICKNQTQLCPLCLASEPYYRLTWNLSVVNICPFHQCLLIDRCPQCQSKIKWSRPSVVRCKCQFDWRYCQPQAVSSERTALAEHIYKLCEMTGWSSADCPHLSENNPVAQLNLSSFVNLLFFLFKFCQTHGIKTDIFPPVTVLNMEQVYPRYFEQLFALCKFLPTELSRLIDIYELSEGSLYWRDMLNLFDFAFSNLVEESWSFIREVFEEHFIQYLRKKSIKKLLISFRKKSRFYSVTISLRKNALLSEKLASRLELKGLNLAQLFALSQVDMYKGTLFFRMLYFPIND